MTDKIREQIMSVRASGKTNMLSVNGVQYYANEMGFYELVVYLENHRDEYAWFIMTGKTEK